MRDRDIADSRTGLEQYARLGMVGRPQGLVGAGGAEEIASRGAVAAGDDLLDQAALESGTD